MANWFQRLFRRASVNVGYTGDSSFANHMRHYGTFAGASINIDQAMSISVVYACVQRVASTIAQLNKTVMSNTVAGTIQVDSPIAKLINHAPNDGQTAYDFWETYIADILLYGKGYAAIVRDPRTTEVLALYRLPPNEVTVKMVGNTRVFVHGERNYLPNEMFCVRNTYGLSVVEQHRETLGLAKAAQDYASEFFGSSGNMTGFLSSREPLKKEQIDIIRDSFNNSGDRLGTKLLPFGFDYNRVSVDPASAQMDQQRDFQNQEICRIFGVPPSLVGVQSNVTYSNTEQQAIQFAKYTVVPWCKRIQQELDMKLLDVDSNEFTKFDLSDLLRGDSATRANYYDTLVKSGIMSINEARAAEDLAPVENGDLNMIQINQIALENLDEWSAKQSSNAV
jgi:HK97 family phage portal protein